MIKQLQDKLALLLVALASADSADRFWILHDIAIVKAQLAMLDKKS